MEWCARRRQEELCFSTSLGPLPAEPHSVSSRLASESLGEPRRAPSAGTLGASATPSQRTGTECTGRVQDPWVCLPRDGIKAAGARPAALCAGWHEELRALPCAGPAPPSCGVRRRCTSSGLPLSQPRPPAREPHGTPQGSPDLRLRPPVSRGQPHVLCAFPPPRLFLRPATGRPRPAPAPWRGPPSESPRR